ncbi:heat-inducible transcriptional repressor HrcA [Streptococcaceae bacterium ESL0687]|nr:heat-inducible transcriptional repressor HrcA [Streptococcaceae bacterium ESL0687]
MLTKRQEEILSLIVIRYGSTRIPVGSKVLMDSIKASSATIRNDMKVLENAGFLKKEHLSSGRVPSVDGYKYFIDNFLKPDQLDRDAIFEIMNSFDHDFYRLSDIFETAASLLASRTGLTSFVMGIPPIDQVLTNFDIVVLDNHSALAVMTLSTGMVKTNQFVLPSSMAVDDVKKISAIVKSRLVGKKVLDIHYALRTEIPQILARFFQVTANLSELFDYIFSVLYEEDIQMVDEYKLLDYAKHNEKLYQLLSDREMLAQKLRGIVKDDNARTIKLGDDDLFENLTLIAQKFIIPYRGMGTALVIAPIDIDYDRVVGIVDLIANILSMKLADYYRYLDGNHYEVQR